MSGLLVLAVLLPILLGGAFLLGRYMRERQREALDFSPVTRQHLDLYQGGQINEAAVEAATRRYRDWLDHGEHARVQASLRPGTQFVVRVRALAAIGTEDAGRILERQLKRQMSSNQMEQAWYWIDLANCLRSLNRDESLPSLLNCVAEADDFPLVHYFAAETVCFFGFQSHLEPDTATGRSALRILHRALEGLRFGVPPQVVVEARVGELLETLWDQRPATPDPLYVRLFAEVRRLLRRTAHAEQLLAEEPMEKEAFEWQLARVLALEPALEDYLHEAGPVLTQALATARGNELRDVLSALDDLRADTGTAVLPLLNNPRIAQREVAVLALRWAREPAVGAFLREWVRRVVPSHRSGRKRKRSWPTRGQSLPATFPYRVILFTLRYHPAPETEQLLLAAAHDFDPAYRCAAVSSLGWWEPLARAEVLLHLQDARFDPSPEVRHAARGALARLGERQALQWFRQALSSDGPQRAHEAILAVALEGLTLLWPDLDRLADSEEPDLAMCAREALEQMQEELDHRQGR